ncbi:MAG TPA: UDP-N-acetylmuramoyl-L-alanyl-D-glutamate--2,6-diaminopimelate ligase [Gammaproteobacteria bacterium]|jgi:UDP-N-acetylmuramoyl-L-alanyl-D-glutamate--2,6-diaminopimelate ligase|nr:UDP-N-acetylmuramoyl-L-alanyl-D-glutamate--2,6-diaminopimelate ligase [Gammaproteobacteria bacterium]
MMATARALSSMPLSEVLRGRADPAAGADTPVLGLALDSRGIGPGYLFLACKGHHHHGLEHLADARRRGAVALAYDPAGADAYLPLPLGLPAAAVADLNAKASGIAAHFYGDPTAHQQVMAVTGTNGKTSVSLITAQSLSEAGKPCGVLGTVGFGAYGKLETPTHTTPDAVSTQAWLARFRDEGLGHVSMEASSHALHQGRVDGVHFTVAVFTNLTRDHLDYHGDMQAYGAAKRRLFERPGLKYAVINLDDAFGRELAATLPARVECIGYTLEDRDGPRGTTLRGSDLQLGSGGLGFDVTSEAGIGHVDSRLLARFNAENLLAVQGTLLALGMSFEATLEALARARTVPGRMECFGGGAKRPLAVVDYAHTPDALEKSLAAARSHCRGRLWCVFGCGGERDRGKRPQMGAIAETLADRIVVTDDNPRGEDGDVIVAEILAGIRDHSRVTVERDRGRAVERAVRGALPGDVVLVAGKGHETEQVIGGQKLHYSDRETAARLMEGAP